MSRHSDDHAPGSTPGLPAEPLPALPMRGQPPTQVPRTPGDPTGAGGRLDPHRTTGTTPAVGPGSGAGTGAGAVPTHGQPMPTQVHHVPVSRYEAAAGDYPSERPTTHTRTTGSHAALPIHAMGPYEEPPPASQAGAGVGAGGDSGPTAMPSPLGLPAATMAGDSNGGYPVPSAGMGGGDAGGGHSGGHGAVPGGPGTGGSSLGSSVGSGAGGGAGEPIPSRAVTTPPVRPPTGATAGSLPPGQLVAGQMRRLSPEQIRTSTFTRSPLGRRGLAEDEVHTFVNRLAEELAARDSEIVRLLDENHRLKQAMRDWQTERIDQPATDAAVERVNAETAVLMARAQQHIDAQIAQTELYCRQREQEAVRRYDEIVRHARSEMRNEAESVAQRYRENAGATYSPDQEQLQRQQVYLGALLQSLDALGAHVQATRQAFATEISRVTTGPDGDERAIEASTRQPSGD